MQLNIGKNNEMIYTPDLTWNRYGKNEINTYAAKDLKKNRNNNVVVFSSGAL